MQRPELGTGSVFESMAKRIRTFVRRSTAFEIVSELLSFKLPIEYKVMRLAARSDTARRLAVEAFARRHPVRSNNAAAASMFPGLSVAEIIYGLKREGFSTGISLSESVLREILTFCASTTFSPNKAPGEGLRVDLNRATNPAPPSHLYNCVDVHKKCTAISALARDSVICRVVAEYLGAEPRLLGTRLFWSYPPAGDAEVLDLPDFGFHYDIDGYKFVKLFFYLTDVESDCGPHVIIAGTHTRKTWFERLHRRIDERRAEAFYPGRIKTMTGRRGEGFFEDTLCYHRGSVPRTRRLIMEFEWSLGPIPN
jgi:hypothetical protein